MKEKAKSEEKTEEVKIEEEVVEEIAASDEQQSEVVMSPEAIESRYQAHLEKIKEGSK